MGINHDFWRGKRVFVTGHTGFKGSWLSLWLRNLGADVCGYAFDPPTTPSFFEIGRIPEILKRDHRADIRSLATLQGAMAGFEPEIVFHLAAQSLVLAGYKDPVGSYSTNVMGTVNLLEAARRVRSTTAVLIVTSDKCYLNSGSAAPHREGDTLGGLDVYGSSKACAELVTSAYRASFAAGPDGSPRIASARAGNVIGGGDWSENRLVPDCIRAFLKGRPALLRHPHATRPWQHVLEPLSGYLLLAERLAAPRGGEFAAAWNFGPDGSDGTTVMDVAAKMAKYWGEGSTVREAEWTIRPHEAPQLRLDSSRARNVLGWCPHWSLERGLSETVDWYLAWHKGSDMQDYSRAQIERYVGLHE